MTDVVQPRSRLRDGRLTIAGLLGRFGFYLAMLILILVFATLSSARPSCAKTPMSRAPSTFRQADVTKALKAAVAAGLRVTGFKLDVNTGKIEVETKNPPGARFGRG